MKDLKVLVIGGNGKTGRKLNKKLVDSGIETRVVSRSSEIPFDWTQPKTWAAAVEGMNAVYITFQPDLAVPGSQEAIQGFTDLAIRMGISRIVLLSGRGEIEAEKCEDIVMNSDSKWTIVRCDWFNQNFSESMFLEPILAGHVALPRSEAKIPFVDTDDIADVAYESFMDEKHVGQIYELTGPRLLTFKDVTDEIAAATKRDIQFTELSFEQYNAMLKELQIPDDYIWLVDYLFTEVLDGRNAKTTDTIEKVLGRKPKDISEYIKETSATGVWNP